MISKRHFIILTASSRAKTGKKKQKVHKIQIWIFYFA